MAEGLLVDAQHTDRRRRLLLLLAGAGLQVRLQSVDGRDVARHVWLVPSLPLSLPVHKGAAFGKYMQISLCLLRLSLETNAIDGCT